SRSPPTFPAPASASQPTAPPSSADGFPSARTNGPTITSPVSITQASVVQGPISRLACAAVSDVTVQASAAPSPPRIEITRPSALERASAAATGPAGAGPFRTSGASSVSGTGAHGGNRPFPP